MTENIRIYMHPTARSEHKVQARKIRKLLGIEKIHELSFPIEPIPENIDTVGVYGGDGSVGEVMKSLINRDEPVFLLIGGGGSQNGLLHNLLAEGVILKTEQIREKDFGSIPDFHPGQVGFENVTNQYIFHHSLELGDWINQIIQINDRLRNSKIPRGFRMFYAVAKYLLVNKDESEFKNEEFRLFFTGNYFGTLKIFSRQGLFDNHLTQVVLKNEKRVEMLRKTLRLSAYILLKKIPPADIANILRSDKFTISNSKGSYSLAGIEGEFIDITGRGDIFVSRSERSIKAAAIVFEG